MPKPNPNARRIPNSSLTYNAAAARYIKPSGRFLSTGTVRKVIDDDITACATRMQEHGAKLKAAAGQFKAGAISEAEYLAKVKDWRDGMAVNVKALHVGNVAAAVGGFHAMDARANGTAGGRIRGQLAYLSNFAIECAGNPDVVLSQEKGKRAFEDRIAAYAEAGRGTFEAASRVEHIRAGFATISNKLEDGAHHCAGSNSCPAMSDLGKVAIDDVRFLMPGFRRCKVHCRCEVEYGMEAV